MEANWSPIIQLADFRPFSRWIVVVPHSRRDICRPGTECLDLPSPVRNLIRGYYFWPVRAASKESYAYRYWNGLPYVGEYAIMRGYLFLRIKPRLDYTYLKPRRLEQLGNGVLIVRGSKWLRQRYELYLRGNEERSVLVQKLISIGAREEDTQTN